MKCDIDNPPVLHGVSLGQPLDNLGDSGPLLADGDVNAIQLLLFVSGIVEPFLVDDGVDGNGSFAGLTITDDQLTLTTSNGHQGVNGLESGLHGLMDGFTGNDT